MSIIDRKTKDIMILEEIDFNREEHQNISNIEMLLRKYLDTYDFKYYQNVLIDTHRIPFVLPYKRLLVVPWGNTLKSPKNIKEDNYRDKEMLSYGFHILSITNYKIKHFEKEIVNRIDKYKFSIKNFHFTMDLIDFINRYEYEKIEELKAEHKIKNDKCVKKLSMKKKNKNNT